MGWKRVHCNWIASLANLPKKTFVFGTGDLGVVVWPWLTWPIAASKNSKTVIDKKEILC